MSCNEQIAILENDVLTVCISDADDGYFMWQKGLTEDVGAEDGIYFEYDDQCNGGEDIVKECTITNDGVHIVLTSGERKHLYFTKGFDKYDELRINLNKIYEEDTSIVEYCI